MSGVSTLFVSANALPAVTSTDFIGGLEICRAMEKVVGVGNVDGSIRISGLWRLQVKNEKSRTVLLTQGISIRGLNITVLSKNPYLVDNQESVKLIIGNLPFSISNEEIKLSLISNGAKAVSTIKWEHYRELKDPSDPDKIPGLTSFKTGRRFCYIAKPSTPLPANLKVANNFTAYLYYKGQKEALAAVKAAADAAAHRAKVYLAAAAAGASRAVKYADTRIVYERFARLPADLHLSSEDGHPADDTLSNDSVSVKSFLQNDILNSTVNNDHSMDKKSADVDVPSMRVNVINPAEEELPPAKSALDATPLSGQTSVISGGGGQTGDHSVINIIGGAELLSQSVSAVSGDAGEAGASQEEQSSAGSLTRTIKNKLPLVQSFFPTFHQRGRASKKPTSIPAPRERSGSLGKRTSTVNRDDEKKKKSSKMVSQTNENHVDISTPDLMKTKNCTLLETQDSLNTVAFRTAPA